MFRERKLSLRKMIELENKLIRDPLDALDKAENELEFQYLVVAFDMPFAEIRDAVWQYETTFPGMDKLEFVHELCKRYGKERGDVLRRIREVKRIDRAGGVGR